MEDKSKKRPLSSNSSQINSKIFTDKDKSLYPKITSKYDINRNDYDPHKTYLPKIESENLYKNNLDLKQTINDLNKKIAFLKSNNQKLSLTISQKNKEIDELTNQILIQNKEKEKLMKNKNDKKNKNCKVY